MEMSWVIAVLLAAMASFISNLGVTLQKLHHLRAAADPRGATDDYSKGWMWRVGLGLVFFGSLADFAALSFGPQSLVAPLGSLTLVSNVIFAPLLLKETIGHWDVVSTVLIVVGSSVAVMFGSHDAVTYTVGQLFGFFTRWDFILYAVIMTIYITTLYMLIQKIEKIEREEGVHSPKYLQYKGLHRFAYPSLSGTVGAQSVLFAKCFVELLATTVRHWSSNTTETPAPLSAGLQHIAGSLNITDSLGTDGTTISLDFTNPNMFVHWQTYFVFFAMFGAIFAQIKYLNEGLKRFDASHAVPVFTSFWIILSVISGMIFYREYVDMNTTQCMFFAFGVLVTVTGVITLGGREQAHYQHQQLPTEESDEEDPSNGFGAAAHDAPHAHAVAHEGSINPSSEVASSHGYSRGGKRGGSHGGSGHGHAAAGAGGVSEHSGSELDLDLDLEGDFDDDAAVSATHTHHPRGVHVARGFVAHEDEGSVTDGAKAAVLEIRTEASQRISQAFSKLRGKGQGDRDALATGIHAAISGNASSSKGRGRSDSAGRLGLPHDSSDSDIDVSVSVSASADGEGDVDPLILSGGKKSKKAARKASSPRNPTASSSTAGTAQGPSITQPPPRHAQHSVSAPVTPFASAASGFTTAEVASVEATLRKGSLTPTAASLYDASPLPSPSMVFQGGPNGNGARSSSDSHLEHEGHARKRSDPSRTKERRD